MTDIRKLAVLLDNPEARELILGLGGAEKIRAVVLDLAGATTADQYGSWLDDGARNKPMTAGQVRLTIGDDALDSIAVFAGGDAVAVAWQLSEVLPDLVDALTPGGTVLEADVLRREIDDATLEDDREAGLFAN
ncbi:YidB family protein [Actinoplanes sp. NPDC051513]|uniref:YidB family protein n=1 Tax=Actinoplanes sp. NPDC051513 TaxID=3363908 RepID=UPI0037BCAB58